MGGRKLEDVEITVYWQNKTASYKNKFEESVFRNPLIIQLTGIISSESSNPLSFTYYNLKGHTIDYLLEGKIDSSWETKLSLHPYIITNEIFKVLNDLRTKFNYTNDPNMYGDGGPPVEYLKKGKSAKLINGNKMLSYYMAGTDDYTVDSIDITHNDDNFSINENEVSLFVNESVKQKLKKSKSRSFTYKWFPTRADLLNIKKSELIALKKRAGEDFPDNTNKLIYCWRSLKTIILTA